MVNPSIQQNKIDNIEELIKYYSSADVTNAIENTNVDSVDYQS